MCESGMKGARSYTAIRARMRLADYTSSESLIPKSPPHVRHYRQAPVSPRIYMGPD